MSMMKYCSVCHKIHDINIQCTRNRTKEMTDEHSFRQTRTWRKKSHEIKERDHHLCQVCLSNKHDTVKRINYTNLEVHHIVPLSEDIESGLDDSNLITLCSYHHKLAEKGKITKEELRSLIECPPTID